MTPLLAELPTPSPEAIGTWLVIAMAVAAMWLRSRKVERELRGQGEKREISPQPLEVQESTVYVDVRRYERDRAELREEQVRQARNRKELYGQVEQLSAALATLQADSTTQGHAIAEMKAGISQMHTRIDAVPGRVIELLRDTKNLL